MKTDELTRLEVEQFCAEIAQNRGWVQAAGGNVSWKTGTKLWIKASGTWLAEAQKKPIFVPLDRALLDKALARKDYYFVPSALENHTLRPSIETMLHALMRQRIVVHLHLVNVVARLVRTECDYEIAALMGGDVNWLLVDYHNPGADLAKVIHAKLVSNPKIQVVLLKNHGVIIGANSIEDAHMMLSELSERFEVKPRNFEAAVALPLYNKIAINPSALGYQPCTNEYLNLLVHDPDHYQRLKDSWAICPDHVVFLGASATFVDDPADLNKCLQSIEPETPFIFVKGQGILQSLGVTASKLAQLLFYLDILERQPIGQPLACLQLDDVTRLLNWDAEKYRQLLNR